MAEKNYNYIDDIGLEYVLRKIHNEFKALRISYDDTNSKLDVTNVQAAIEAIVSDLGDKIDSEALTTILSDYMLKSGGTFTGAITLPAVAEGTNDNTAATTAFVAAAIATALADVTGISFDGPYESLDDLKTKVTNPKKGTIYLVKSGGAKPNVSDEYFWDDTRKEFELFGSTEIDLSGYVQRDELKAITTAEIDKMLSDAGYDVQVTTS